MICSVRFEIIFLSSPIFPCMELEILERIYTFRNIRHFIDTIHNILSFIFMSSDIYLPIQNS